MLLLQSIVFPIVDVLPPRYGQIYNILFDDHNTTSLLEISLDVHVSTLSQ